jgi:hypothetical protein
MSNQEPGKMLSDCLKRRGGVVFAPNLHLHRKFPGLGRQHSFISGFMSFADGTEHLTMTSLLAVVPFGSIICRCQSLLLPIVRQFPLQKRTKELFSILFVAFLK